MDYGKTWQKITKLVHQYFMEAHVREAASPCPARRGDSDDEGGLYGRSGSSYGSAEEIQQTVISPIL